MQARGMSRRGVIRFGAAGFGYSLFSSLSGCGEPDSTAQRTQYEEWMPDPETFPWGGEYPFRFYDVTALLSHEDVLSDEQYSYLENEVQLDLERFLDPSELTAKLFFSTFSVVELRINTDDAVERYRDEGFEETDVHNGFQIIRDDQGRFVAFGEGKMINPAAHRYAPDDETITQEEMIRTIIDTIRGSNARYVETDEDVRTFIEASGQTEFLTGRRLLSVEPRRSVDQILTQVKATGYTLRIDRSKVRSERIFVFESSEAVDPGGVQDFFEYYRDHASEPTGGVRFVRPEWDIDGIREDGRVVVLSIAKPTETLYQ